MNVFTPVDIGHILSIVLIKIWKDHVYSLKFFIKAWIMKRKGEPILPMLPKVHGNDIMASYGRISIINKQIVEESIYD